MDDVTQILERFDQGDDASAFAALDSLPPHSRVEAYDRAQRHAYWTRKHLARTRAISRAGIRQATQLADAADDATADAFLGRAKTLAYNLASFTWPGWDEPGIAPSAEDLADGRDAARLNLRLAIRLAKPDRVLADAHWLIGAHALAAGDLAAAAEAFAEARTFAVGVGEAIHVAMLDGYASLLASLTNAGAVEAFEAIVASLRASGEGGASYAEQLSVARRVFMQ